MLGVRIGRGGMGTGGSGRGATNEVGAEGGPETVGGGSSGGCCAVRLLGDCGIVGV
jgi:hypothetical protein